MAFVSETVDVDAPITRVFDFVADARQGMRWLEGFTRFEPVLGFGAVVPPTGVGSQVRVAGQRFGLSVESVLTVVEFEKNRRFTSRSGGPISSETTWLFEEIPGGTRVTFQGTYRIPLLLRAVGDRMVASEVG